MGAEGGGASWSPQRESGYNVVAARNNQQVCGLVCQHVSAGNEESGGNSHFQKTRKCISGVFANIYGGSTAPLCMKGEVCCVIMWSQGLRDVCLWSATSAGKR